MIIKTKDITPVSEELALPFKEDRDLFQFDIDKDDHSFVLQFLKDGKYIYIGFIYENQKYQIEHLEYYWEVTREEMLEELRMYLNKLKSSESRVVVKKSWLRTRIRIELKEHNEWANFGYSNKY